MEKIEVGYRQLGSLMGVEYYHKFIIYTNSSGQQYTISGWTDPSTATAARPDGYIDVKVNLPFNSSNPDNPDNPYNINKKQYRELLQSGVD